MKEREEKRKGVGERASEGEAGKKERRKGGREK